MAASQVQATRVRRRDRRRARAGRLRGRRRAPRPPTRSPPRAPSSPRSSTAPRRGRDDFEGHKTRRVYALFAKTRAFDHPATHPLVLEVLDRVLGEYQLSAPTGIEIGAGEVAQPLHPDDALYPDPAPAHRARGQRHVAARRLHRGERRDPGRAREPPLGRRASRARHRDGRVEMPAGSALIYLGSLWHGGGANRTDQAAARCRAALRGRVAPAGREPRARGAARRRRRPARADAGAARVQHLLAVHRLRRRPPPAPAPRADRQAGRIARPSR